MQWFDTPYAGYRVTRDGRVKGPKGVLVPSTNGTGYEQVTLRGEWGRLRRAVHVLMCETFYGPRPTPGSRAKRKSEDRSDNSAGNLYWWSPPQATAPRGGIVSAYLSGEEFAALEAAVEETGRSRSSIIKEAIRESLGMGNRSVS